MVNKNFKQNHVYGKMIQIPREGLVENADWENLLSNSGDLE